MFRKLLFSSLIFFSACAVTAQNTDSLALVKAKWNKQKIAPKIKLIRFHFKEKELFKANENISYLEIKNKGKSSRLIIGAEDTLLKPVSIFGDKANALAAVNGSFFDVKNGGAVDFIKKDGRVLANNRLLKDSVRAIHQRAAIAITNGRLQIEKWDGSDNWEQKITAENVMVSGPLLIYNGMDELISLTDSFNTVRHPRTCIGIKNNGKLIILTVDGRNSNAEGMSLPELTKIMRWLGCKAAINLDGGGSTTLWVKDFPNNGVINYPSDNKKWDHEGERNVANVILLQK
ncbi:phosphodiester glycosidase family protein [Pedobacter sp. MC2016-14]|uniref:phosphodiester glycosidase family protein n=1 Tax=Pedobacter sp. MC2016-14 TaxID=2897327 RepID=UPI001E5CD19E|nr:phosphodiester glycosidase family protein [Pedobacter sp. MC2016-14]MCD0487305.1 phosphodiester glycosidase family protein [Pedobacter sp. MC2016-14]